MLAVKNGYCDIVETLLTYNDNTNSNYIVDMSKTDKVCNCENKKTYL